MPRLLKPDFSPSIMPCIRVRGPVGPVLLLAVLALAAPGRLAAQNANLVGVRNFSVVAVENGPAGVRGNMLLGTDGNIYVASAGGGSNGGGAFARITPSGAISVIGSLTGGDGVGAQPYSGPIQGSDGNFYGTTYVGGKNGRGTVYRVTSGGEYTTLYSFLGDKGSPNLPYGGLVQAADGTLYGTTLRGGTDDAGTVFRISLAGDLSVLYSFTGGKDGKNPEGTLVAGPDGSYYGTTLIGGDHDRGVIFRMTPAGQISTLYSFPALSEFNNQGVAINVSGANPRAGLLLGPDGNFYGTAYQGGANGFGTLFRMAPSGTVTTLHDFAGPPDDGAFPLSSVSVDSAGNYYGTTERGGPLGRGSVWTYRADGTFGMLHGLVGAVEDGLTPYAAVLPVGSDLYVVSFTDNLAQSGALFKLQLPVAGVLPVNLSISPAQITSGQSANATWSSTGAASCVKAGGWTGDVSTSGSTVLTPEAAGYYSYTISCTDGAGVVHSAYAWLVVKAPAQEPVDGGGGGGTIPASLLVVMGAMFMLSRLKKPEAR